MAERRRYTDEERAQAVLFLEAAGYPDRPGALAEAERATGIAGNVLKRWTVGAQNPPPAHIVAEKRGDLVERFESLLDKLITHMEETLPDARFSETSIAAGIVADKLANLTGMLPAQHHKIEFITSTIGPAQPLMLQSEQSTTDAEYTVMSSESITPV